MKKRKIFHELFHIITEKNILQYFPDWNKCQKIRCVFRIKAL